MHSSLHATLTAFLAFRRLGLLRASALICLLICGWPNTSHARPFDLIGSDWEGCADFVRLARDELGDPRVRVVSRLELSSLRPIDSVILLHPERTLDVGSLARFMKDGGRVLLLDDYGTGDTLLEHFSLRRVASPHDPIATILDNPQLPIAEPDGAHPVVAGVSRVLTNHPTGIRHNDLSSLLLIRRSVGDPVNVAVAGMVGKGRLLAVGDPSIVMNAMLRYPGNRAFARGLIGYAADQDTWGKRDGYVYVVAGAFEQKGAYGEDSAGAAEWAERLRGAKDVLQEMRREGVSPGLAYGMAILLGLGLVLWVGANAARVHKPMAPRFTRPIPLLAQGGVAGHVAVLAAPSTSRALAMLELKSALEERLSDLLDLERIPPPDVLLSDLTQAGLLGGADLAALKALLARMAHIETMVLSRRAAGLARIPDAEVIETARVARGILARAETAKAGRGAYRAGEVASRSPDAAVP